jgi:Tol biopolymer transport system component/tRNA A-37 threonylcarbamoyl transferase component Bud32
MIQAADLIDVAAQVADGLPVDWARIESESDNPSYRALLQRFRLIERVAQVHTSLPPVSSFSVHGSLLHPSLSDRNRPGDIPVTWGPLTILEKIGRGTYGDVYRARDPRLDRPVALKLLRRRERDADALESAVVEEGRLMARVRHPNVVTIYGAERIDGRVGLWMEFVGGRTLEDELRERGPFAAADLLSVGRALAGALDAVHRAGLLHRDVKAQNAMRDTDGRVLLTDFGAGEDIGETTGEDQGLAGTPLYLAPEVLAGQRASVASDIYSLGVVLYHLATGSFPVRGRSLRDLRDAHKRNGVAHLNTVRPDLPRWLSATIERALAPNPGERFATALELEEALARIGSKAVKRRPAIWLAVAVVAAALVVGAVIVSSSRFATRYGSGNSGNSPRFGAAAVATGITLRELSQDSGLVGGGAPSPDGRYLSFADGERSGLTVYEIATGKRIPVAKAGQHESVGRSRFSPDSSSLAFVWYVDGRPELRTARIDGTNVRTLYAIAWDKADMTLGDWSSDGQSIPALLLDSEDNGRLALISTRDGSVREVKRFGSQQPTGFNLSPDQRFLAYDIQHPKTRDLFLVDLATGRERPITSEASNEAQPIWVSSSDLLFLSDRTGASGLWRMAIDRHGIPVGDPTLVRDNLGARLQLKGLTHDGRLYLALGVGLVDVYEATIDMALGSVVRPASRATSGTAGANIMPAWSREGRLAFVRRRDAAIGAETHALVVREPDGREKVNRADAFEFIVRPRWAPDGQSIMLKGRVGEHWGLHRFWLASGQTQKILADTVGEYGWGPGGRSVLYAKGPRILERDLDGGSERLIHQATGHVSSLSTSRSGSMMAFTVNIEDDATVLRIAPTTPNAPVRDLKRLPAGQLQFVQDWTIDDTGLLVRILPWPPTTPKNDGSSLWIVDTSTGQMRPTGLTMDGLRDLQLHPDGSRVAFSGGWPENRVWVLENFLDSAAR